MANHSDTCLACPGAAEALSAIERKQSRGGRFREDYPDKSAEFGGVKLMARARGGIVSPVKIENPS